MWEWERAADVPYLPHISRVLRYSCGGGLLPNKAAWSTAERKYIPPPPQRPRDI